VGKVENTVAQFHTDGGATWTPGPQGFKVVKLTVPSTARSVSTLVGESRGPRLEFLLVEEAITSEAFDHPTKPCHLKDLSEGIRRSVQAR